MKHWNMAMVAGAVALALTGCGSDSGSDSNSTTPVTLSVSDAPVDDVSEVVVTYSKVAFLPLGGGDPVVVEVYKRDAEGNLIDENGDPLPDGQEPLPLSVNLLDFQGSDAQALVEDQVLDNGDYKLCVFANDGDHPEYPSYVVETASGNQYPLTVKGEGKCPQGVGEEPNAGVLYFNDTFTVNNQNDDFVLEFDLRRGLKEDTTSPDNYTIQRTSVALINTVTTGEIEGEIATATYGACETDSPSGNGYAHAVYLYSGDVAQADMGTFAGTGSVAPLSAANVTTDDNGISYEYEFGYLAPGTYSIGYTCTANDDSEEGIVDGETFRIHASQSNIVVTAGQGSEANL
ncbi:DUF4382 domain-containing protein [Vibrio proteolyticus]